MPSCQSLAVDLIGRLRRGEQDHALLVGLGDRSGIRLGVFRDDDGGHFVERCDGNNIEMGLQGDPDISLFGTGHDTREQVGAVTACGSDAGKIPGFREHG